jgi:hypothetical protein
MQFAALPFVYVFNHDLSSRISKHSLFLILNISLC